MTLNFGVQVVQLHFLPHFHASQIFLMEKNGACIGWGSPGCERVSLWLYPGFCPVLWYLQIAELVVLSRVCVPTISGEGNGTPLQYPCLENPMDGGA